ncbi:N-acetylmuramic acid 6-phosphate etherase [Parapedobacter pyrenivorans]|uniref:N-acetylmuramic acid 6-phosphate etherase n=1 Tax=Parapedobacter pyrenivorans TaxID=1305674 RepID=A0A917I0M3_9SPHI|nr:N-acetylmuramic acid 6-phosphate etherase [Parapedobacter pyrenivorans]GGG99673.1 N-acetylmuramic acid 6-phosphate etherase [Parapedobacter pyrenivorans]
MKFNKITEQPSNYRHLEQMETVDVLRNINNEDTNVPPAVARVIPQIALLVDQIKKRLMDGGRLFYIGAGTSGRLGVLDASECPPTYGVPATLVIGIMAGGDEALRNGLEEVEDSEDAGWRDLEVHGITAQDVVLGIAASGTTPYVIGALRKAQERNILTGCIVCNLDSPVASHADYPIEVVVGPEFVTGSTRMKSGTAQKLVLNMISTAVMIGLGLVEDNQMVNMQISNNKLVDRGIRMVMKQGRIQDYEEAKTLLLRNGSVKLALQELLRTTTNEDHGT